MTSQEKPILPGAAEFLIDYEKKADQIRAKYPHCIIARGFQEYQQYLREYRLSEKDLFEIFPWSKFSFFQTAQKELPFIFLTAKAKKVFPEEIQTLSVYAQKAQKLYSAWDLAQYFRKTLVSSLQTVAVPISLFVGDIALFRSDFMAEKQGYLITKSNNRNVIPLPNYWKSVSKHLPKVVLDEVLLWEDDLKELKEKQQKSSVSRVVLSEFTVELPEKILPVFLSPRAIAIRNACASSSSGYDIIRRRGWAKHTLITPTGAVYGYTPGPLLGSTKNWDDYRIGATVLMLPKRAEALLGKAALKHCKHWNIPHDLMFKQWNSFRADPYQPMTDMEFLHPLSPKKSS